MNNAERKPIPFRYWLCEMAVFASVRFFHSRGESSLPRLTRDK